MANTSQSQERRMGSRGGDGCYPRSLSFFFFFFSFHSFTKHPLGAYSKNFEEGKNVIWPPAENIGRVV